jgi:desulfoferrodoxin
MAQFKCSVCGYISFTSKPIRCLVCNSPAEKFDRNDRIFEESSERSKEAAVKHIPAIAINKKCGLIPEESCVDVTVRIGEKLHPMESAHFISFIDCYTDDEFVSRVQLTPGVFAAACFHIKSKASKVTVVERCNLHGYWKTEVSL